MDDEGSDYFGIWWEATVGLETRERNEIVDILAKMVRCSML